MNLGIGDAYSVANAIKEHIEAKQNADNDHTSDDAVLQRYAESRRKVGEEVIAVTGQMTWFAYMNYGWRRIVRNSLIQIVGFLPFVKRMVVWRMSGLGYRNI
jgi:2-polyprenyl-6-methoxyphenol hydroxylase-like FAD-dependent oxidoreductase